MTDFCFMNLIVGEVDWTGTARKKTHVYRAVVLKILPPGEIYPTDLFQSAHGAARGIGNL